MVKCVIISFARKEELSWVLVISTVTPSYRRIFIVVDEFDKDDGFSCELLESY